jgi:hypothetical protein
VPLPLQPDESCSVERALVGKHRVRCLIQVRFPSLPERTGPMTCTIPRRTPGGLLSVRLSPASPGAFPQLPIRFVALLRPPPDCGASPWTRLSRAPRWGGTPTSTPPEPPPRLRRVLLPPWRCSPGGASHGGVCSGSGLGGCVEGLPWPPHCSPWHPVQDFPCPLRWTLQRGGGGGALPIPTALCGSQPGRR